MKHFDAINVGYGVQKDVVHPHERQMIEVALLF